MQLAAERFHEESLDGPRDRRTAKSREVPDETHQARYIIERVLEGREGGSMLKQQAVLFRASHHSGPLEVELTRRNIPFRKFGGLKFLDASHVKDLLALLRFAENPRDRNRWLSPDAAVARSWTEIGARRAGPDGQQRTAHRRAHRSRSPPRRCGARWHEFIDIVVSLGARQTPWPAEVARRVNGKSRSSNGSHEDAVTRREDLIQLEQIASSYPSRERFLAELTLDPPDATSNEAGALLLDEDYLILSTIHSAKGQEWKSVYS